MSSSASVEIGFNVGDTDVLCSSKIIVSARRSPYSVTGSFWEALVPKIPCKEAVPFWNSYITEGKLAVWNASSAPKHNLPFTTLSFKMTRLCNGSDSFMQRETGCLLSWGGTMSLKRAESDLLRPYLMSSCWCNSLKSQTLIKSC